MTVLILITLLLLGAELLYFRIADRYNIIDKPNQRSSHTQVTLRGGGIVFLFGAWLYSAFYGFTYPYFLAGVTAVALISFLDDIRSVSNGIRLAVQGGAMLLMCLEFELFTSTAWGWIPLVLFVCTGITNAYNFMDGINGITGGYSLVVLGSLLCVNGKTPFIDGHLLYAMCASVAVFCLFNFRKRAKCFAGDVGAVTVAFTIVFALGLLMIKSLEFWYLIFLVVYGVDAVLTIMHRVLLKEKISEPHRKHLYQLMANELKIPHVGVASLYMGLQAVISLGAIYLPVNKWGYFVAVVVLLSTLYVVLKRRYFHLHQR